MTAYSSVSYTITDSLKNPTGKVKVDQNGNVTFNAVGEYVITITAVTTHNVRKESTYNLSVKANPIIIKQKKTDKESEYTYKQDSTGSLTDVVIRYNHKNSTYRNIGITAEFKYPDSKKTENISTEVSSGTAECTYSSSDDKLTYKKTGSAILTFKGNSGQTTACNVKVNKSSDIQVSLVDSSGKTVDNNSVISVDYHTYAVAKSKNIKIQGDTESDMIEAYSYKSSDVSVATVDSKGNVNVLKPGKTTVTVYASSKDESAVSFKEASYTLNVTPTEVSVKADGLPNDNIYTVKELDYNGDNKLYINSGITVKAYADGKEVEGNFDYTYRIDEDELTVECDADGAYVSNPDDLERLKAYIVDIYFADPDGKYKAKDASGR